MTTNEAINRYTFSDGESYEKRLAKLNTMLNQGVVDEETYKIMRSQLYARYGVKKIERTMLFPDIKKVIFNPPATIVFWDDGTKTVVKAQNGEVFDPEKGITVAIAKKAYGNKGSYFDKVKKWSEIYNPGESFTINFKEYNLGEVVKEALSDLEKSAKRATNALRRIEV